MGRHGARLVSAAMLILGLSGWTVALAEPGAKLLPPASGVYHGAFPDFGPEEDIVTTSRLRRFTAETAEKPITWAYFSDNWFDGIRYPRAAVQRISASGALPFIRMMARADWREGCGSDRYSLQSIIDGRHDRPLRTYARRVAEHAEPLIIEFGTEVNGDWFPWSGVCNGGDRRDGYGSSNAADGPERFRDAYRHIIDIFNAEGAQNVTWVLHLNAYGATDDGWNSFAAYYPGPDYIDWIGVSVYGAQTAGELRNWNPSFTQVMDDVYSELAAIDREKPLAILEFGVVEHPEKAGWIQNALTALRDGRYPRVRAMSYWHSDWPNDNGRWSRMRLDSSRESAATYRTIIADPAFVSEPRISR